MYVCGNFHTWAFSRFQEPQQLGRAQIACSSHTCVCSEPGRSQRPALLQAAAETTAVLYWRRRRLFSGASLQRGWSARMATRWSSNRARVLYGIGLHMSLRRRTILFYGRPLASPSPFTLFAGRYHHHGRQNRRPSFCVGRGENLVTIVRFAQPCLPICTTTFKL